MLLQVGRAIPTSPWELVLTSSRETKFVLAILVLFSIASWYFIVLKWWQFRRMRAHADRFMVEIEKAARLEDAYHVAMRLPSSLARRTEWRLTPLGDKHVPLGDKTMTERFAQPDRRP